MSDSHLFELIFEGPADDSDDTLRKLRTSLLADVGLSVMEAQDALKNAPKTLKVSEAEEDLKPLYAALKRAGAKVLLVRPQEDGVDGDGTNEKAYFLDLEETKLDDELLKSLEALPGEEEPGIPDSTPALDLTSQLETIEDLESITAAVVQSEASSNSDDADKAADDVLPPPLEVDPPLGEITFDVESPRAPEPARESFPAPSNDIADKPLFEFDEAKPDLPESRAEQTTVAKADPPSATPSSPLFEFESSPGEQPKEEQKPESPPSPPTVESKPAPEDFSLSIEPEEPVASQPKAEAGDPAFSADELSSSLSGQLEAEQLPAKERKVSDSDAPKLSFDTVEEPLPPAPSSSIAKPVAERVAEKPQPKAIAPVEVPAEHPADTEPPPPPANFKPRIKEPAIGMDIIAPIVIGAAILGVANWTYFSSDHSTVALPQISIPDEEPSMVPSERSRLRGPISTTEKSSSGSRVDSTYTVRWTLVADQGELKRVSVELLTPQPAELTAAQIVRGERPAVWLRKIEILDFPFEKQLDGSWLAKGPARLFLEQGTNKRRLIGQTEISVPAGSTLDAAGAKLSITRGYPSLAADDAPQFSFEPQPNGDVRLIVRTLLKN